MTPAVGWSVTAVSIMMAVNELCKVFGTVLAQKYSRRLKDWQIFCIPIVTVAIGCLILTICLSPATIILYLCFGLATGWVSATMMPMVKEQVAPSEQSTIESAARVASGVLYMVSVWLINLAAGIAYNLGFLITVAIFVPLALIVLPKLIPEKR